jgi:hypothetical protein
MPTFNGDTLTSLAGGQQIGIENDNQLPNSGALTWKHVNTPTDLAGTTGIDCKLIHGDFFQQIGTSGANVLCTTNVAGNEIDNVSVSRKTSIGNNAAPDPSLDSSVPSGSWQIAIGGNEDITIYGNLNQEVYGESKFVYVDSQDTTLNQIVTYDYSSPAVTQQPTSYFQANGWVCATYDGNTQNAIFNNQNALINMQTALQNYQIAISNFQASFINYAPDGNKVSIAWLDDAIKAVGVKIQGAANQVAGIKFLGTAAKIVGGVILGPNQFM